MANKLIPASLRQGCIADIGCGNYPLFLLNANFRKKIGLEKTVGPNLDDAGDRLIILKHDVEISNSLPLGEAECDVVTMLAVLEHVTPAQASKLLNEIYRVLRPGGLLIITTPAPWTGFILRRMAKLGLVSPEEIHDHKAAYGLDSIFSLLKQTKFSEKLFRGGYFELFMNCWAIAFKEG
jgi:SAM-dependent methyltransferase